MSRNLPLTLVLIISACADPADVNVHVHLPEENVTESPDLPPTDEPTDSNDDAPVDEPTEFVYYVADLGNQIHQTNTQLEFRDAVYWFESYTPNDIDTTCMMVTVGVPEQAEQGVFINKIDFGAIGLDLDNTGWMNDLDTFGAGSNVLLNNSFVIFRDPDELAGSQAYYGQQVWLDQSPTAPNWHGRFGCWGDACHTSAFGVTPDYYIPAGADATLGVCMVWWGASDHGEPSQDDWMKLILGEIHWTPADTEDFTSNSVDGLWLPTGAKSFTEIVDPT